MARKRLTARVRERRSVEDSIPYPGSVNQPGRKFKNRAEYDNWKEVVNHPLPDMRTDWRGDSRDDIGFGIPEGNSPTVASVRVAASKAVRLAVLLLGDKVGDEVIEEQSRDLMAMSQQAMDRTLGRFAETQELYQAADDDDDDDDDDKDDSDSKEAGEMPPQFKENAQKKKDEAAAKKDDGKKDDAKEDKKDDKKEASDEDFEAAVQARLAEVQTEKAKQATEDRAAAIEAEVQRRLSSDDDDKDDDKDDKDDKKEAADDDKRGGGAGPKQDGTGPHGQGKGPGGGKADGSGLKDKDEDSKDATAKDATDEITFNDEGRKSGELDIELTGAMADEAEPDPEADARLAAVLFDDEPEPVQRKAAKPAQAKTGIKKLGGQPKVASGGDGVADISDIWNSAPDVSEIFG